MVDQFCPRMLPHILRQNEHMRGVAELEKTNNAVTVIGTLGAKPVFSHAGINEKYYIFPLEICRLSGTVDVINVIAGQRLMEQTQVEDGSRIQITGELRSFNNKSGVGNKLVITVFAREIRFTDEEDKNEVCLTGTFCRAPNLRCTPMGREICDLMVAVNRRYGRSDYLPCIVWGRLAETAAQWPTGTKVDLVGRIQSRKYIKVLDGLQEEKIAFEVSVSSIAPASEGETEGDPAMS